MTVQPGVFALGAPEHCHLEFDLAPGADARSVLRDLCEKHDLLTTFGGVNVVLGVRPSLWARIAPDQVPADAADFTEDVVGPDGFRMPATQHDLWAWVAGGDRTTVFDTTRTLLGGVGAAATVGAETTGWLYRHDRDLTGFVDGTENPTLLEAPAVVAVPDGSPGAGCSVVLLQQWRHDTDAWTALPVAEQEAVMGRTKADSVEFTEDAMPDSAHVARTSFDVDGVEQHIFRRNVAYGDVADHGTMFVGFACDQWRMAEMLRRMAGLPSGDDPAVRCALTRYTTPLTGSYYVVPSVELLATL